MNGVLSLGAGAVSARRKRPLRNHMLALVLGIRDITITLLGAA